ncbi:MAG: hypothetical protein MUF84_17175 [Anaerolineae bacterium]|jgi:hypothetical protein|nr:hypothetical protein [Anaerolineae bacterium]
MPYTVLVHLLNEDSVVGELEELPESSQQFIELKSPRLRDGREVSYLLAETNTVLYPWTRIHCVEIMPTEGDEQIVTFIRD